MTGPRLNPSLLKVPLYIAGKSAEEVESELGLEEVIKLASNESPIGPSPMGIEAARLMLSEAHRYPGLSERELRRKLAASLDSGFTEENFVTGNGGTDVLRMITQAFVFDGGNTIVANATFPMYHILTTTFGGEPRMVPRTTDYRHDLAAMADKIDSDTRIVFLCSPNNPTGNVVTKAEADDFIDRLPDHVVLVFDESYYDFVTNPDSVDSLAYVKKGYNVLAMRSFSKTSGLANLRVGYAVGPVELIQYLRHLQLPFHTGAIALSAAAASLDDHDFMTRNKKAVIEGRNYLYDTMRALGFQVLPSQANFLTIVDSPMEPASLCAALQRKGFIIRPMEVFGMPDAIRVTVGTMEENEKFVTTLQKILERETVLKFPL